MKRQLFASVNPIPFGEDAEEAANIVDDLPCILRWQGLPRAGLEKASRSFKERLVNDTPTRKQPGIGIALNAAFYNASRNSHRFRPEHICIGTRVAEIASAPNSRYVRLSFFFYSV